MIFYTQDICEQTILIAYPGSRSGIDFDIFRNEDNIFIPINLRNKLIKGISDVELSKVTPKQIQKNLLIKKLGNDPMLMASIIYDLSGGNIARE